MKWFLVYWCVMCGVAGLGFHALYKAIYLFWVITGPLVYEDTRHVDYLFRHWALVCRILGVRRWRVLVVEPEPGL